MAEWFCHGVPGKGIQRCSCVRYNHLLAILDFKNQYQTSATLKRFELTLTVFQNIKREWNSPKYARELYRKRLLPCISWRTKIIYMHSEIGYLRIAHLSRMYSMICPRKSSKLSSGDFTCPTGEHLTTSTCDLYAPIKGRLNSWLPTQVLVVWVLF